MQWISSIHYTLEDVFTSHDANDLTKTQHTFEWTQYVMHTYRYSEQNIRKKEALLHNLLPSLNGNALTYV